MSATAPARHVSDVVPTPSMALSRVGATLAERPYARRGIPPSDRIMRLLLVEQQALMRQAFRALLQSCDTVEVVADAPDATAATALLEAKRPDLVLLGLGMPRDEWLDAVRLLQAMASPRILVLTSIPEEHGLIDALNAGAHGYLTTDAHESEVFEAMRVVAGGEIYVRPRVARLLAAHQWTTPRSPQARQRAAFERLSQRERVVVERFAQGYAGVEIGRQLGISNKTIETYKERISDKLGLRHRSEYVRFALEIGLLHP